MTFFEWCAAGAKIGVTAFFAVFVFCLCLGVIAGVITFFAAAFGGDDE